MRSPSLLQFEASVVDPNNTVHVLRPNFDGYFNAMRKSADGLPSSTEGPVVINKRRKLVVHRIKVIEDNDRARLEVLV